MSFILLGILNSQASGAGGIQFFISINTHSSSASSGNTGGVALTSLSEFIVAGAENQNVSSGVVTKQNANGTFQWQRGLRAENQNLTIDWRSVGIDASGDVYVGGRVGPSQSFGLIKYSSSGTLLYQRRISLSSNDLQYLRVNPTNGDVFFSGTANIAETDQFGQPKNVNGVAVMRVTTTGSIVWQRRLRRGDFGSDGTFGHQIAINSSGDSYVVADATVPQRSLLVAKYNISGSLQFQKRLTSDLMGKGIGLDTAGNVYATGNTTTPRPRKLVLVKYNSSGTIQFQRQLTHSTDLNGERIATDSENNVYILGRSNDRREIVLVSYDSSGTIRWQRKFRNSSASANQLQARDIHVDEFDTIYFLAGIVVSGSTRGVLVRVPSDGSLTGNYVIEGNTFVYENHNMSSSTSTFTDTSGGHDNRTTSMSINTNNDTSISVDQTNTFTEIG